MYAESRLAEDQLVRLGHGAEALEMVDRAIADRPGAALAAVVDLRCSEQEAPEGAYAMGAKRHRGHYGTRWAA